jgi:hypothetical protein
MSMPRLLVTIFVAWGHRFGTDLRSNESEGMTRRAMALGKRVDDIGTKTASTVATMDAVDGAAGSAEGLARATET